MAKSVYWESKDWAGWIRQNNLEDLLDEQRFVFRPFRSLKKLLGIPQERQARQKAKDVFCDFMQSVAKDMIDDRVVFVFPKRRFGFMRIANVADDPGSSRYVKHIAQDFQVPGGKLFLDRLVYRVNGQKGYRFKLVGPLMKRLRENRFNGVRYVE